MATDDKLREDDDIIDLTELVSPGKRPQAAGGVSTGVDFGADLDALLGEVANAAPQQAAAGNSDESFARVAVPTANINEADHLVDPDEKLDLPSMDDLDSLLAELGAGKPASQKAPDAPAAGNSDPNYDDLDALPTKDTASSQSGASEADLLDELLAAPAPSAPESPSAGLDLDELLAEAAAKDGKPSVAAKADAPKTKPAMDVDALLAEYAPRAESIPAPEAVAEEAVPAQADLDELLGERAPEASLAPPVADLGELLAEHAPKTEPALAQEVAAEEALEAVAEDAAPARTESADSAKNEDAGIDLNELDAMLDDMLAKAPPSGPSPSASEPAPQSEEQIQPAETPPAAPVPESQAVQEGLDLLQAEYEALKSAHADLAGECSVLKDGQARLESEYAALKDAHESLKDEYAGLNGEVAALRDAQASFEAALALHKDAVSGEMAVLRAELADLRENMEKYAAASAARVIREEIAALAATL